jgi:hypothetical protein
MRVMRWNWNLIAEARTKLLNSANGRMIVRVASDGHKLINRADERNDDIIVFVLFVDDAPCNHSTEPRWNRDVNPD